MKLRLSLFLTFLLLGMISLSPAPVSAHGHDFQSEVDACQRDPNSPQCICHSVRDIAMVP